MCNSGGNIFGHSNVSMDLAFGHHRITCRDGFMVVLTEKIPQFCLF